MNSFKEKYIGSKEFYKKTLVIALPLALQMLLNNCMAIVDTMMVSSIGMVSAVGNAAQIIVLNDGIAWGIFAGISMFSSQFYGAKQVHNLKKAFGLNIILSLMTSITWITITYLFGEELLYFYLPDHEVVQYSIQYLQIAILSTLTYAFTSSFMGILRSTHQIKVVLCVSVTGAILNVVLNALFIYYFDLHVKGAALGTLVSQSIVCLIYLTYSIKTKQKFLGSFKELFFIEKEFYKPIIKKMLPLVINETLFGFGLTLFVKAYGYLGTTSMEAYYIANQIYNLFTFIISGYGSAISILIGTRLGEGKLAQAKKESNYQLFLSLIIAVALSSIMLIFADNILMLFSIKNPTVFNLAKGLIYALALKIFFRVFNFTMFSTLRAGGDSKKLSILDAGLMYTIGITLAFILVLFVKVDNIIILVFAVQLEQIIRMILTYKTYKTYSWVNDLTVLIN